MRQEVESSDFFMVGLGRIAKVLEPGARSMHCSLYKRGSTFIVLFVVRCHGASEVELARERIMEDSPGRSSMIRISTYEGKSR